MSDGWTSADRRSARIREEAVRDVLERDISVVGAAVLWGVQVADLQRWIDDATSCAPTP